MLNNMLNENQQQPVLENDYGITEPNVTKNQEGMGMMELDRQNQVDNIPVEAPEVGMPGKSVSFDVNKNPSDMQFMVDSMAYAPMLKNMSKEQRKEKWPGMVEQLSQVSPKAKTMLDPTLPPTDKDLDAMMAQLPKKPEIDVEKETAKFQGSYKMVTGLNTELMSTSEIMGTAQHLALLDVGGEKDPRFDGAPSGYAWKDPETKKTLVDLREEKIKKGKSPEQATKEMMLKQCQALLPTIKHLLFSKGEGKVDWDLVRNSNLPLVGGQMPWNTDAKRMGMAMEVCVQGGTRGETGAAMPSGEVKNFRKRYQPDVWDTEDSVVQKYITLELFVNGSLDLMQDSDPNKPKLDKEKMKAMDSEIALEVLNYKKEWIKRAAAMPENKNATVEQLHQLFNKSLLYDKKFIKQLKERMKNK